ISAQASPTRTGGRNARVEESAQLRVRQGVTYGARRSLGWKSLGGLGATTGEIIGMAAISQTRPARTTNVRTPLFILGVGLALLAFLVMFAFGILFANRSQTGSQEIGRAS